MFLVAAASLPDDPDETCDLRSYYDSNRQYFRTLVVLFPISNAGHALHFNEFLASYVGYAYLGARHPHHALSSEVFWNYELGHTSHPFTGLNDFETRYLELQQKFPGNYGWYQLALDQRVMEVYRKGGRKLSTARLLKILEAMSPRWIAWSKRLEHGQVSAAEFTCN